ncbi:beta-N-acetylhexosaminidase [Allopseudospirillum japonicum]|uniref:Beta-hexosaminidase n=1 Tax=Allopseudospirillum japonicum TaxID=64971 RepID=A0A1H6RVK3_9GAMM|nr:beta-N-acetylhexosaminidase [Allopseudospirillum japonicum]SEI59878.1 beta-N-acetylhexosaminidase [Allopseudospirillum japonicum]
MYAPLMLDLGSTQISAVEQAILEHPCVGGVILFARNLVDPEQTAALCQQIKNLRPDLLIAIDQEGGRVQRLRQGLTALPPMATLGAYYQKSPLEAIQAAHLLGYLMAAELLVLGIDISFAPVLDRDYQRSQVIGNRAFANHPWVLIALADAFIQGMQAAGMQATGKHFPGHGYVEADSHTDLPEDNRSWVQISACLAPFAALSARLGGIMPAHVKYTQLDQHPAGFSAFWLQQVLRQQLGFRGAIFSDDLSMEGAREAGDYSQAARAALQAGCDMVLVCNQPEQAQQVLADLPTLLTELTFARQCASRLALAKMRASVPVRTSLTWQAQLDQHFDREKLTRARVWAAHLLEHDKTHS